MMDRTYELLFYVYVGGAAGYHGARNLFLGEATGGRLLGVVLLVFLLLWIAFVCAYIRRPVLPVPRDEMLLTGSPHFNARTARRSQREERTEASPPGSRSARGTKTTRRGPRQ